MPKVTKLSPHIGAEIGGLDLSQPLSQADIDAVQAAFHAHKVLVFRDQQLGKADFARFSGQFGPLQRHVLDHWLADDLPEVMVLTNYARGGEKRASNAERSARFWHSDLSFTSRPALATALYGVEVPRDGGGTEFADMCAAYDALPAERRQELIRLEAVHDLEYCQAHVPQAPLTAKQKAEAPPVKQPVVRVHPVTGRNALYVSELHASHIDGMAVDAGRALIDELCAFAVQPQFLYRHDWRPGDVVIWDNRCTLHRGTPYNEAQNRLLWRTTINGEPCVRAERA